MTRRFNDRTVLVTGGARGMGAAHVRGFAREGANVVIADVLAEEGTTLAHELGDAAVFVNLDVTSEKQWIDAIRVGETAFGPISVLVNNAGISGVPAPLVETDLSAWRQVISVNLDGAFLGIKSTVPSIRRAGGGAIVNISSFAGLMGSPFLGAYAASKFGLRGLTKLAAMELGALGIRVNSVHPGYVRTPLLEGVSDQAVHGRLAIAHIANPEEITPIVLFAASDGAAYCTGAEFVIDGGWSAGEPTPLFIAPGGGMQELTP